VLALALVTAVAVARAAGAEPGWLAAVQLAPTVVLLVAAAMLADIALSDPSPDAAGASAVAVALALVATLDEQRPSQLDVELVLAGAGDGPALGAGAYVRRRRRRWDAARVALLEIRPAEAGRPAFWVKDGPLVALRLHPRLIELAVACARAEPHLGATPQRGRDNSAAYRARRARWPALAVGALDDRGIVPRRRGGDDQPHSIELEAMEATLAFCLALVAALDEDLAGRQDAGTRQEASA
jgi:hypothetical protein